VSLSKQCLKQFYVVMTKIEREIMYIVQISLTFLWYSTGNGYATDDNRNN